MSKFRPHQVNPVQQSEAYAAVLEAASEVRDCPRCYAGWRQQGNGVTRCECWPGYREAWNDLYQLEGDRFYPTHEMMRIN